MSGSDWYCDVESTRSRTINLDMYGDGDEEDEEEAEVEAVDDDQKILGIIYCHPQ